MVLVNLKIPKKTTVRIMEQKLSRIKNADTKVRNGFVLSEGNKQIISSVTLLLQLLNDLLNEAYEEEEVILSLIQKVNKAKHFYEITVPKYSLSTFKFHFRVHRSTVEALLEIIEFPHSSRYGRPTIPKEKAILLTLWYLGNRESVRSVATRFNVNGSTAHRYIYAVSGYICRKAGDYISWPNDAAMGHSEAYFHDHTGFPGVLGCLGSSHIRVWSTKRNNIDGVYTNCYGWSSMLLQGVCNEKKKFIHVQGGWPGSTAKAQAYRASELSFLLSAIPWECHVVSDAAYPLVLGVMIPFKKGDQSLTTQQERFNDVHSKIRLGIDRTFTLLKGRFRVLESILIYNIFLVPIIVIACCILHNICVDLDDEHFPIASCKKEPNVTEEECPEQERTEDNEAIEKRNELAEYLSDNFFIYL